MGERKEGEGREEKKEKERKKNETKRKKNKKKRKEESKPFLLPTQGPHEAQSTIIYPAD